MRSSEGYALLSVISIVSALLVASVAAVKMTGMELRGTADNVGRRKAFYVAEAGVQHAIARLSQDRATASTSTSYTYSASAQPYADGTYSVSVAQDPTFPSDASRKEVTGIGQAVGQFARVVAQVRVQDVNGAGGAGGCGGTGVPESSICFTDLGTCKIQALIGAATELFNGMILSNHDATIETTVGLSVNGSGSICARDRFHDLPITITGIGGPGAVLSTLGASLYTGFAYTPSGLLSGPVNVPLLGLLEDPHQPPPGPNGIGIHFANGTNGHGEVQAIPARTFPLPDWESLRRDPRTVIVNAQNAPSGTSWDAASGTWIVASQLEPAIDEDVIYYVEGNAHVVSLQLRKGARMTIAARGWTAIESLSVLNTGLVAGSRQDVRVLAQDSNTIGLKVLSYSPLGLESTLTAVTPTLGMAAGVALNVAGVATNDNRVFAYSETGDVWTKTSTLSAISGSRFSMIAKQNATFAFTGSVGAAVLPYQ